METLRKKLDPLVKNGTIAGFFLGDELLCACVPLDFIAVMAKTVVETYPNTNVWYNEGSGEVVKPNARIRPSFISRPMCLFFQLIYTTTVLSLGG